MEEVITQSEEIKEKQEPCKHEGKWKVIGIAARASDTSKTRPNFVMGIFCKKCGFIKVNIL